MANCLGIYLKDNIIKYAKVSINSTKEAKLESYGIRYVNGSRDDIVKKIVEETNSKNDKIAINPQQDTYVGLQVYEQAKEKGVVADIAKMEFEAWCEKNSSEEKSNAFVYKISDLKTPEGKHKGFLNISSKQELEKLKGNLNVTNIIPTPTLITDLVDEDEKNYILVNLDENLSMVTVLNGKFFELKVYDIGMKSIFNPLTEKYTSFQKAYEMCKQLNVFSESEEEDVKQIERLVEPVLQEILKEVAIVVGMHREEITKVMLAGDGVVFTNVDILFREYLDVKTEILRPKFVQNTKDVRNIAEILETVPAIALAYEALNPKNPSLEYVDLSREKIKKGFSSLFARKPKILDKDGLEKLNDKPKQKDTTKLLPNINFGEFNYTKYIVIVSIVAIVVLVVYILFSSIYYSNVQKMVAENKKKTELIKKENASINEDTTYINTNTAMYKEINAEVQDLIQQIESSKIGKFTTYNVATFLQNIIKVIPKNVTLKTISSDDNKNIKIVAESNSYADLGYFVSELKLQGTLKGVKINSVKNGAVTSIEIGGELP